MSIKTLTAGMLLAAFAAVAGINPATAQIEPAATQETQNTAVSDEQAVKYATDLYLAYVLTSSTRVNNDSRNGVTALAVELVKRTSIEPAGVAALDIENDELAFFPFIYWPITQNAPALSEKAQKKVQNYINTGGVILFDIRDNSTALQTVLRNISIKPLIPMGEDHTLTRSFYLTAGLPGSTTSGTIWVEAPAAKNKNSVSALIIGENNWAGAWAAKTLPQNSKDRENALRAGINIVTFALSGNYKSDQTHLPSILERLDKR